MSTARGNSFGLTSPNRRHLSSSLYNFYKNILNKKLPDSFDSSQWLKDLESKMVVSSSELKWVDLREYNFLVENDGNTLLIDENSKLLSNFFLEALDGLYQYFEEVCVPCNR